MNNFDPKSTQDGSQPQAEPAARQDSQNGHNGAASQGRAASQTGSKKYPAYLWPLALAFSIFLASGSTRLATPDLGFHFSKDKIAHFLVFGLLATAILRTPRFNDRRMGNLLFAALLASAYGGLDELRQSLTPGRSVELADWLADTLGALVAVFVYARWHDYRRLLEWRVPRPIKHKRQGETFD